MLLCVGMSFVSVVECDSGSCFSDVQGIIIVEVEIARKFEGLAGVWWDDLLVARAWSCALEAPDPQ